MAEDSSQHSHSTISEPQSCIKLSNPRHINLESPLKRETSVPWLRTRSTPPETTDDSLLNRPSRLKRDQVTQDNDTDSFQDRLRRSKKKSQFFERAFGSRQPRNAAEDRIVKDSTVTVDVKLNCPSHELEQHFQYDLSFALSEVYQRPASCIMVMVSTDISILVHGTLDPAYHVTVTAIPSDVAATKNKRSAFFIQQFMEGHVGICPNRGVIKFEAISLENLVTNGATALQEIEMLERVSVDDRTFRWTQYCSVLTRKTLENQQPQGNTKPNSTTRTTYAVGSSEQCPQPANQSERKIRNPKSLMSFFGI